MDKIFEITAKEVTIQVKDERTGVEYSRTLPMDYYENANVLKLRRARVRIMIHAEHISRKISNIIGTFF